MKIIQEHVSLSAQKPFLVSVFNEPDLSYPFHHHRYAFELTATLGLSGTRMVGDNTEQFPDCDIVLMAPGLPHCWQDHGVRSGTKHKVVVVQFSAKLISESQRHANHYQKITSVLERSKYGLELLSPYKEVALEWIYELKENNSLDTYFSILKILELFNNESVVRKLCSEGYKEPAMKDSSGKLEMVLQYIQEHYARKISIEEVASQVHMSPSAFSHYFKKRTRKSYIDFVMELRLGKAAQLLQLDDMPVTRVGYESGFQNISHFNRSFSKKYKNTPLNFRKQSLR